MLNMLTKFKDKKILITGNTGFKGSWLTYWLNSYGAKIYGFSDRVITDPSIYDALGLGEEITQYWGDIRDYGMLNDAIIDCNPDYIFHFAAQSLVAKSYENPLETFTTNFNGTLNLLEIVRVANSRVNVVIITSDKSYKNVEQLWGYKEDDLIGGLDPYSASKSSTEMLIHGYFNSFFKAQNTVRLAVARAGNVIGGGDWSDSRLVPDAIRAWSGGHELIIRNPSSTRPWQHVLEPLSGYLVLAEQLYLNGEKYAEAWNFGPEENDVKSVRSIIEYLVERWGDGSSWIHDESEQPYEAQLLKLDISKAKKLLGWQPKWDLFEALDSIIEWQKAWLSGRDIKAVTLNQIRQFEDS